MTTPMPIRILCVDDHPVLREGVAAMIDTQSDMRLVGEAGGGEESVALFRALLPDVTLMDLQMPGMDGFAAIQAIRAELPTAKIIVFTTFEGHAQAARALKSGAAGYLLKSTLRRDLLNTIRSVYAGRRHVPAEIAQEIALHSSEKPLTERELDILRLVSEGYSNKAIARAVSLAEDTVKAHLKRVFAKLEVDDRTHAVTTAKRRGILE